MVDLIIGSSVLLVLVPSFQYGFPHICMSYAVLKDGLCFRDQYPWNCISVQLILTVYKAVQPLVYGLGRLQFLNYFHCFSTEFSKEREQTHISRRLGGLGTVCYVFPLLKR